MTTTEK